MSKGTCLILAPDGTKVSPIVDHVLRAGWLVAGVGDVFPPRDKVTADAVVSSLTAAEAVIFVIDSDPKPEMLMAIGIAFGAERPSLVVVTSEIDYLALGQEEPLVAAMPRVHAQLTDEPALNLHITAFLDGARKGTAQPSHDGHQGRLNHESGSTSGVFRLGLSAAASNLERRVYEALSGAPEVNAVHQQPDRPKGVDTYAPDFAIWLSGNRKTDFTNPVLLEVTSQSLDANSLTRKLDRMRSYAIESGLGSAMILVEARFHEPPLAVNLHPLTLRIGEKDFVDLVSQGKLLATIVNARNKLAHSER